MSRSLRRISIVTVVALLAVAGIAAPASAALVWPPRGWCNASTANTIWYEINAAEVNPTLTHFMSINIAPGTTGERTETLSRVNSVSTTIGGSVEISSSAGAIFAKVSVKVGFSVQSTTASTDTETTSMRWTFNEPGYYGLYKGTRAVAGSYTSFRCIRQDLPPPLGTAYNVWNMGESQYTTFDNIEVGTVRCDDQVPAGTLRFKARLQLGC
ncbi:hypothetical protein ACN28C_14635 [Plantactinospora sp. WMMC1484]|uniref:hypothetical protein n=1 Tax=Plantactinospora sp. WMMC1484 TaxID=3404122 RepID=UPI003BF5967D